MFNVSIFISPKSVTYGVREVMFTAHAYMPVSEVVSGENIRETPVVEILSFPEVTTALPSTVHTTFGLNVKPLRE